MVDYDKSTGSTGIMKIRDTGGNIEFWIYAGSATFDRQMYWNYSTPHGGSGRLVYDFSGGAWRHIGTVNVTASGNVNFHLEATGTSGLGGPTDHTVYINRASRPSPPGAPYFWELSNSHTRVLFNDGANNGAAIDNRELWYSTDPNNAAWIWKTAPDANDEHVTGLTKGTTYYFWGKTHNSQGWSDLSARSEITTHREPDRPTTVSLSEIGQNSIRTQFAGQYDGGAAVEEWQLGYGMDPLYPQSFLRADSGVSYLTNLSPGRKYYFWARGRNYVGWGEWCTRSEATLIAGASVKTGATWSRAVPYVNVNGVWRLAKPYAKGAGVWKEATS